MVSLQSSTQICVFLFPFYLSATSGMWGHFEEVLHHAHHIEASLKQHPFRWWTGSPRESRPKGWSRCFRRTWLFNRLITAMHICIDKQKYCVPRQNMPEGSPCEHLHWQWLSHLPLSGLEDVFAHLVTFGCITSQTSFPENSISTSENRANSKSSLMLFCIPW